MQLQADTISVSGNPICLPVILNREDNYVAGKLSHFIREWEKYTDDPWILGLIAGVKVEFIASPPGKRDVLREYQFSSKDSHDLHTASHERYFSPPRPALTDRDQRSTSGQRR